jgi:hypothetical protein
MKLSLPFFSLSDAVSRGVPMLTEWVVLLLPGGQLLPRLSAVERVFAPHVLSDSSSELSTSPSPVSSITGLSNHLAYAFSLGDIPGATCVPGHMQQGPQPSLRGRHR